MVPGMPPMPGIGGGVDLGSGGGFQGGGSSASGQSDGSLAIGAKTYNFGNGNSGSGGGGLIGQTPLLIVGAVALVGLLVWKR